MLRVSISGFYYWLQHPVDLKAGKEQQLLAAVKKVYWQSGGCYASPKMQWICRKALTKNSPTDAQTRYSQHYPPEISGANH
ncbi:hypothetical protein AHMF7605_22650 [Adhaeribacter arboris]|uniref:HTH-like domain-containing protein n=1 Tax=Adhaeribacter arboris TaxID=2072846 RepID=A0A2T2YKR7_9BACT|nr:hypothetical protein [Adhaeribacter arboris]PSR56102.1 hypothetical protein AHMF7605_22650 [Adhaeribacter arboris]